MQPGMLIQYFKEDDDWDFLVISMDLFIFYYLIPQQKFNYDAVQQYWQEKDIGGLSQRLLQGEGELALNQWLMLADAVDALTKLMLAEDDFHAPIFESVCRLTRRFGTYEEFEAYYMEHASSLLRTFKAFFDKFSTLPHVYDRIFNYWKMNSSYEVWYSKHGQVVSKH